MICDYVTFLLKHWLNLIVLKFFFLLFDVYFLFSGTVAVICRMGEVGKRNRPQRDRGDRNGDNKNQKRRVNDKDERDRGELVVYRILCPDGVIGSVIGKSGKVINSIRQETRAKVKVVDPFPGAKNRVITIYCHVKDKEEIDAEDEFDNDKPLCAAQDALIKVHSAISNATEAAGDSEKKRKSKEECQILVPSSQSAIMIGKAGATIKRMRVKTKTNIKVISKDAADPEHSCAMEFDNFVVVGVYLLLLSYILILS